MRPPGWAGAARLHPVHRLRRLLGLCIAGAGLLIMIGHAMAQLRS
ncbi:MAG TPA: hypothetical protein VLA16_25190 [Ideonella sp.]|nr:hypothetical protein [Ideonella sp.]